MAGPMLDQGVNEDEFDETRDDWAKSIPPSLRRRLGLSFFLFGLINNVLYVIILSAALDLVPPSTPKGIIAFMNIFPALVAKVGWPYILRGKIRYGRRIVGCCALSVLGMIVVAAQDSLAGRLLGISLASFSSGLGELTFLQLSTTYAPRTIAGHAVGLFASGTGAAGLVGAFLWWELRILGVRTGVGISTVLPFINPVAYWFLLPSTSAFKDISPAVYAPLSTAENGDVEEEDVVADEVEASAVMTVSLSTKDKWRLVRPLLSRYMFPLFCVYLFEYTINQGIAPTLLYPVPNKENYWFLSKVIQSIRDYYPLWQLVYQTTVFLSRSSITLGVPPLPHRLLPLPAIVQAVILTALVIESAAGIVPRNAEGWAIGMVFALISLEGICGGLAYVNVFYRVNQHRAPVVDGNVERAKQEQEFRIGSIGFADSLGILAASLVAVPMEVFLCNTQIRRGRTLCQGL